MTTDELLRIVADIKFLDRQFEIRELNGLGWTIQVTYFEPDVYTGKPELQKSRKWLIEPNATDEDVVHTVFAACERSFNHVLREHFTYLGVRVYSPHMHLKDRLKIAP